MVCVLCISPNKHCFENLRNLRPEKEVRKLLAELASEALKPNCVWCWAPQETSGQLSEASFCSLLLLLDNSDLIACTVITKDGGMVQRFLAVDIYQMSLVEPDVSRLGWGVVKFAGLLQVRVLRTRLPSQPAPHTHA